jgi:hypothetical protein
MFLNKSAYGNKHNMHAEDKTLLSGLLLHIKAMSQALSHISVGSEMHEQRLYGNRWPMTLYIQRLCADIHYQGDEALTVVGLGAIATGVVCKAQAYLFRQMQADL